MWRGNDEREPFLLDVLRRLRLLPTDLDGNECICHLTRSWPSFTVRTTATRLVQEGEVLLREANKSGSGQIRQQAVISASTLFSQALALNPPPDILVYVWIEPGEFDGSAPTNRLAG